MFILVCDSDLAKGKGRIPSREYIITFSVLCRSNKDAISCFNWYFTNIYENTKQLSVDDGELSLKRKIIDSRNFTCDYMMMDGIRQPFFLSDLKSNMLRYSKIF